MFIAAINRTTSDTLQEKSDNLENFLDRFNDAFVRSGLSLVQFCRKIGVSRSLFYEIRDGKRTVSDKVWRKLEAAERAAGITTERDTFPAPIAVREGDPKDSVGPQLESFRRQMAEMHARIQAAVEGAQFSMAELEARMQAAGAWPASPEDRRMTPGQLWVKYAPPG